MHADDAVVDLAATAQPLATDTDGFMAALGRCGFVQTTDGQGVGVVAGNQLLAMIAQAGLIPLD